ncbi:TM245-like protein [Mya arenaria]|uniref:TM245-like protein n=1 Tax=Mya arenaria TaxID=6604 RepID=A0ABY7E461_MYAAR|nr:TM245-like protein [Mya arenaria]
MASTPNPETRSPLTLLKGLPKEHEKAIKQAFYNTAANVFLLLACAAAIAVYFILEAFLKPLLWAVLCGSFLYPFKSTLTKTLRNWLNNLHQSETPFLVGVVITPIKCADNAIDTVCNAIFSRKKLVVGICLSITAAYVLWHFGPLWGIFFFIKGILIGIYDVLEYFGSFWIWTIFGAYLVAIVFFWREQTKDILRYMSIPMWIIVIFHLAATAGVLRVPLFFLMAVGVVVGLMAEKNEIKRQEEHGPGTPSPSSTEEIQPKPEICKPRSLNVQPDILRRPRQKHSNLASTPTEPATPKKSLSDQCFVGLFWALVLTRVWLHVWVVAFLLPIPVAIWAVKKLSLKLGSAEGPLGDKVKIVRRGLAEWIRDRKDVVMPQWLRGVARIVMKGDQKIIMILESSLDKTTSILFILLLLVGSTLFGIFFAIQVQQESIWLPNNEDVQQAMDSMVGNAYLYGRNYIAAKVRDMVNGPADNNTHIETQVLDMWDRLYESWLARNSTSTSLTKPGQQMNFDITNLSSIWSVVTQGDGFNFGDIITFTKENIGTFVSVLESIWLVLKGNMNLVFTVLTSTLSLVFGGGTALLNFVIFLTTLFYLLASSGDQYKPVEWFSGMSPTMGGNTFGQAVQDAVGGVFMASLKMAVFYGLYTWLTHSLFGVNIVFIPSALAAIFGAVPFVGTYLAAIPAVLELWLVQDRFVLAIVLLVIHFLPSYVVDTAIYSEIKGGHPYMTGLAIAGGMYWLGLEGAIFGPIILCCLIVLVNVYSTMIRPESPGILQRSHSVL